MGVITAKDLCLSAGDEIHAYFTTRLLSKIIIKTECTEIFIRYDRQISLTQIK